MKTHLITALALSPIALFAQMPEGKCPPPIPADNGGAFHRTNDENPAFLKEVLFDAENDVRYSYSGVAANGHADFMVISTNQDLGTAAIQLGDPSEQYAEAIDILGSDPENCRLKNNALGQCLVYEAARKKYVPAQVYMGVLFAKQFPDLAYKLLKPALQRTTESNVHAVEVLQSVVDRLRKEAIARLDEELKASAGQPWTDESTTFKTEKF